ncbi:hypothetical protein PAHAL_2G209700 [Panicum hallii]|uniref:Uncharacterized protein n=1 Tax=Panicum hallii TaxID=206008 RepID=A0A2S3GYI3_9POAL|nr:hypothetical protein PAHAL_2G209700 [Panicum hallii]
MPHLPRRAASAPHRRHHLPRRAAPCRLHLQRRARGRRRRASPPAQSLARSGSRSDPSPATSSRTAVLRLPTGPIYSAVLLPIGPISDDELKDGSAAPPRRPHLPHGSARGWQRRTSAPAPSPARFCLRTAPRRLPAGLMSSRMMTTLVTAENGELLQVPVTRGERLAAPTRGDGCDATSGSG